MSLFKVDRASASTKSFDAPGIYSVEIIKAESSLTTKGEDTVKLIFRGADGSVASDNFLNRESVWWRLNALLAACPFVEIPEGQELDFSKARIFQEFLGRFVGAKCKIKLEEETWVKEGTTEEKKTLKIRKYLPETNPF
jgi:hypothetical protein